MIRHKKGQAAMEFLMTYGWALLVVLIAIGALAFFGLLNPSRFLPEKCELAPGLTCMDFNAVYDGENTSITILLNNGVGKTMRDVRINTTDCDSVINATILTTLTEGSTESIQINCTGPIPNTRFKSDMKLTYNTSVEGITLTHSKTGFIVVQVDQS